MLQLFYWTCAVLFSPDERSYCAISFQNNCFEFFLWWCSSVVKFLLIFSVICHKTYIPIWNFCVAPLLKPANKPKICNHSRIVKHSFFSFPKLAYFRDKGDRIWLWTDLVSPLITTAEQNYCLKKAFTTIYLHDPSWTFKATPPCQSSILQTVSPKFLNQNRSPSTEFIEYTCHRFRNSGAFSR